mmetsp:Transcript_17203/g.51469  ORF Transcript_17203/g.51469 Transcript_17203/m.51469 type:complete len:226 (-) Transcript_17203:1208-1885(-)
MAASELPASNAPAPVANRDRTPGKRWGGDASSAVRRWRARLATSRGFPRGWGRGGVSAAGIPGSLPAASSPAGTLRSTCTQRPAAASQRPISLCPAAMYTRAGCAPAAGPAGDATPAAPPLGGRPSCPGGAAAASIASIPPVGCCQPCTGMRKRMSHSVHRPRSVPVSSHAWRPLAAAPGAPAAASAARWATIPSRGAARSVQASPFMRVSQACRPPCCVVYSSV